MSLIRSLYTIMVLPIPIVAVISLQRKFAHISGKAQWDLKNPMQNFSNISQAKPKELYSRVAPLHIKSRVPLIHQGILGVDNKKEADTMANNLTNIAGMAIGCAITTVPVIRFFTRCLNQTSVAECTQTTINDALFYSAIPLMAGACFISLVAKAFIIGPLFTNFAKDPFQVSRLKMLNVEYEKMLRALNTLLDIPVDDPKFQEKIPVVRQFLRICPYVENELHNSLSLDRKQVQDLLIPLKTACRHLLIKYEAAENKETGKNR